MSILNNLNGPQAPDVSQAEYLKKEQQAAAELARVQTKNAQQLAQLRTQLLKQVDAEARKLGKETEDYLAQYGLNKRLEAIKTEYAARLTQEKDFLDELQQLGRNNSSTEDVLDAKQHKDKLKRLGKEAETKKKLLHELRAEEAASAAKIAKQEATSESKLATSLEATTKAQLAELERITKASLAAISDATPETVEIAEPSDSESTSTRVSEVETQPASMTLTPTLEAVEVPATSITLTPILGDVGELSADITLNPVIGEIERQSADLTLNPVIDEVEKQSADIALNPVVGEIEKQSADVTLNPVIGEVEKQTADIALNPIVGEIEKQSADVLLTPVLGELPEVQDLEALASVVPVVESLEEISGVARLTPIVEDIGEVTVPAKIVPEVEAVPEQKADISLTPVLATDVPLDQEATLRLAVETGDIDVPDTLIGDITLTPKVGEIGTIQSELELTPKVLPIEDTTQESTLRIIPQLDPTIESILPTETSIKVKPETLGTVQVPAEPVSTESSVAAEKEIADLRLANVADILESEDSLLDYRLSREEDIAATRLSSIDLLLLRELELKKVSAQGERAEQVSPDTNPIVTEIASPPPPPPPDDNIEDFNEDDYVPENPANPDPPKPPVQENNLDKKGANDPNKVDPLTEEDAYSKSILRLNELKVKAHNEDIERNNALIQLKEDAFNNYLVNHGVSLQTLSEMAGKTEKQLQDIEAERHKNKLTLLEEEIEAKKEAEEANIRAEEEQKAAASGGEVDEAAIQARVAQANMAYDIELDNAKRLEDARFAAAAENISLAYNLRSKADKVAEEAVKTSRFATEEELKEKRESYASSEAKKWLELRKKALKEESKFSEKFQNSKVGKFMGTMGSSIDAGAMYNDLMAKDDMDEEAAKKAVQEAKQQELDAKFEALGNIINELASEGKEAVSHQTPVDVRLQGLSTNEKEGGIKKILGSYWRKIESDITVAVGMSPFVLQSDVMKSMEDLVRKGIAFNVEERGFLNEIKNKIADTFEAADGTLLKLVRIQQADTTAARLGMESMLTSFLNSMYATSEYMTEAAEAVRSSLFATTSLMEAKEATDFEFQVQKWLGSLHSVGFTAAEDLASALGKIAAGDIEPLTSDSGMGNLLIMAANEASIPIAQILEKGLTADQTNTLLAQTVNYLAKIHGETKNSRVLAQQYANVFGVTATDLRAAASLLPSVEAVLKKTETYDDMLGQLYDMAGSMITRTSMGDMFENLKTNFKFTMAATLANNPVLSSLNLMANMLNDLVGGIEIPFINVYGFGFQLNATIADLMNVAALSGTVLGGAAKLLASIVSGGGGGKGMLRLFGVDQGELDVLTRGKAASSTAIGGTSTSESGYVGNESGEDIQNKTMKDASEGPEKQVAEAKEDQEAKEDARTQAVVDQIVNIYDLLQEVVLGSKKLHVQLEIGNAPLNWQSASWYN